MALLEVAGETGTSGTSLRCQSQGNRISCQFLNSGGFRAAFFALSHTTMAVASELRCNAYPSTNSKARTFAPRRIPLRRAPLHRRCYLTTVAILGAEPSATLCEGATICPDAKTNPNTTIHAIRIVAKAIAKGPRFRSSRVSRSYGRGRCGFRDIA
jgi:hypothetical protein